MPEQEAIEHYEAWSRKVALRLFRELYPDDPTSDENFFRSAPCESIAPADLEVSPKATEAEARKVPDKDGWIKVKNRRKPRNRKSAATVNSLGPRRYIVDSGASFHLVSKDTLSSKEKLSISPLEEEIPIQTANGKVLFSETCQVFIHELGLKVKALLLDCTVAVFFLGLLCDENGYTYTWRPQEPPVLSKGNRRIVCYTNHNVPLICSGVGSQNFSVPAERNLSPEPNEESDLEMQGLNEGPSEEEIITIKPASHLILKRLKGWAERRPTFSKQPPT
jgi:hypothetical protein